LRSAGEPERLGRQAAVAESGSWDWADGGEGGVAGELPDFDVSVPSPARIWNYWVGGKDHFQADREAAEKVIEVMPFMPLIAQAARRFLAGAVTMLATDYGVRQFLDIGTGLPVADNTHEVAQRTAPDSRIVYVDNDPIVLTHARALLTSGSTGRTDYIHADLRDTDKILAGAAGTLDLSRPVAVLLIEILHFIPDADDPYGVIGRLMDGLPSGSYLAIAHAPSDIEVETTAAMTERYNQNSPVPITMRTREQVTRFFDGLELVEPGVVMAGQWPAPSAAGVDMAGRVAGWCGVGLKR
jgi:trans-aconitate methyltransferase